MLAEAKSKYVRISPCKLRPLARVVQGTRVDKALAMLKAHATRRVSPLAKAIFSAFSNAKHRMMQENVSMTDFIIKEARVDTGPVVKYFKPGAMGRASAQRKRLSHVYVVVEKQ